MNKLEKKIVKGFNLEWGKAQEAQRDLFKELLYLKESRGGGKGGSLQGALEYLMTSEDSQCRAHALSIFQEYYRLQGFIDAEGELFQEFANKGVDWK